MTAIPREDGTATAALGPAGEKLRRRMLSPLWLRLFMSKNLPLGLLAGLRIRALDATRCEASVRYRWMTTNPFRSTYFAALAMAAEMSCGALAMLHVRIAPAPISMLPVRMEADFLKKATGLTTFSCEAGADLAAAVARTLETGEPATCRVETVGRAADGVEVARFAFGWSFKRKD